MSRAERFSPWHAGACLLALLLPFGEGGSTPAALLLVHTLVLLGALAFALQMDAQPRPRALPAELAMPVPLFLGAILLSSWNSPYPYASFLRCWDLGIAALLLVLVRGAGWDTRQRQVLGDCVLASAALQALVVLGGALRGDSAEMLGRFGLLNSNHEAAYLNLGVLLGAGSWSGRGIRGRWIRGAGLLACLAAIALLASRGALLGLLAALPILAGTGWRKLSHRARGIVAGLFLLLLAGSLFAIAHRFTVAGDPFPYERTRIWRADLECFAGSPLTGVGPGIFRHVAQRYNFPLEGPVRYGRSFITPHSDYLGLLVETGILGFCAGLFLLGGLFLRIRRHSLEAPGEGTGLLAACAALAVQGLVEDLSQRPALLLTVALLVAALPWRPEEDCSREAHGQPGFRTRPLLFAAVPLLVLWWVGVLNPYRAFRYDQAMRHASTLSEMQGRFDAAVRANPYQSATWRFPASAFLAARPPVELTLDLYSRFRRELDQALRVDSTSADLLITRGRLERRAFQDLFHDTNAAGRALASYREGVRQAPLDPRPRVEMAGFLRDLGRGPEALAQVKEALMEEPGFLAARLLLASLLLEEGDREGALREWRGAASLRMRLLTYRPESPYATDITRDDPELERFLTERLTPS